MTNKPQILLETKRNNLTDETYFGSYYLAKDDCIIKSFGLDINNIVYLRSLAKPLQSSIMCDCNIIKDFNIKDKELAIFSGSHSGSNTHIKLLKTIIKKYGLKISDLELEPLEPLDKRNFNHHKTKLHNNCSGKHIMMILMSKYLNLDIKNYTSEKHPIQQLIYKKQTELSGYKSEYLTFDGCSTPLWGLTVKNLITAYFNLFSDEKYLKIINPILKFPFIFGGFNRLDTEIIKLSNSRLFSKVGAGGFVLVYNIKDKAILLLKMSQNNNEARKLILLDMLNKLHWIDYDIQKYVYNQKDKIVAEYEYKFCI